MRLYFIYESNIGPGLMRHASEISKLFKDGMSPDDIATKFGIARSTVILIIKKHNKGYGGYIPVSFKLRDRYHLMYLSYKQARLVVRRAGIKTKDEYRRFVDEYNGKLRVPSISDIALRGAKAPLKLPISPNKVYDEWVSWYEFLGTERGDYFYFDYI